MLYEPKKQVSPSFSANNKLSINTFFAVVDLASMCTTGFAGVAISAHPDSIWDSIVTHWDDVCLGTLLPTIRKLLRSLQTSSLNFFGRLYHSLPMSK